MVRLKHRYLLLQILYLDGSSSLPGSLAFHSPSSDTLTASILARTIRDSVAEQFGDYGAGLTSASLQVKYFSNPTSTAILRVSRAHHRLVWAACTTLTHLPDRAKSRRECVIRVLRVSGTIKKAELEAVKRAKQVIETARRAGGGELLARSSEMSTAPVDDDVDDDEDDDMDLDED
ncbi:hypothetical protein K461DRAFT_278685 [Myriangium duriaei CBS 260.36]|uniref:Uncharacterized protein n=1 Tax=Myriangium duriaei CBS 260.36 TaxID=1168546 RepID=A0A9P4MGR6_9PEZI|nr:hypothetical protein K461DRAFT_278685 [Myriangium duriaei CBS 260.36]